jgi:iron complex transport system ATP-binding protein
MLKLDNIWYRYQEAWILKEINFFCPKGQFISILGPNGVGKTTLLYLMAGIIKPKKGAIFIKGKALTKIFSRERAKSIALLPQLNDFSFPFKVAEIIALGRLPYLSPFKSLKQKDKTIIEKAMQIIGILDLKERKVNGLSGGERQRVLLPRALAQTPEVLLLDEPATYLDLKYRLDLFSILKELKTKKQLTIILVTHDLNLVFTYSDKAIFLKEGGIYKQGEPKEIINKALVEEVYGIRTKLSYSNLFKGFMP